MLSASQLQSLAHGLFPPDEGRKVATVSSLNLNSEVMYEYWLCCLDAGSETTPDWLIGCCSWSQQQRNCINLVGQGLCLFGMLRKLRAAKVSYIIYRAECSGLTAASESRRI